MRILIVDDDHFTLLAMARPLRKAGYEVVEAMRAEQVMTAAEHGEFTIAVIDIFMSGMGALRRSSVFMREAQNVRFMQSHQAWVICLRKTRLKQRLRSALKAVSRSQLILMHCWILYVKLARRPRKQPLKVKFCLFRGCSTNIFGTYRANKFTC